MAPAGGQKEARIEVRISLEQKAFITRGANANFQSISDFILSSAQEKAEIILADQKEFALPQDRWDKFVAALERPAIEHPRLAKLISEPSVLER